MGIVVAGAVFVDIKGFPDAKYIPDGRNAGHVEYIHGGVSRNVVEDIANIELRPTFLGIVDDSALGIEVVEKLRKHKVNTEYIQTVPNGMGTWLAVFDNNGDLAGSISQRPNLMPILELLEEKGDEIYENADSIVVEVDMDKEIVKKMVQLAEKHHKKLYGVVSNMSIAVERRDFLQRFDCLICNQLEAGIFFTDDYSEKTPDEMMEIISERVISGQIPSMIVTMGGEGVVFADMSGEKGFCPAKKVQVIDTTGAGDSFCAGVVCGLTYGKTMAESVEIGTRLAASVITSSENVCPRFLPAEFGIEVKVDDGAGKGEKNFPKQSLKERFEFRNIRPEEAEQAAEIEQICFPPNEACSPKMMRERVAIAPELFLVAVDRETGKIAGFLNGLSTDESLLRDEFFTNAELYDPKGANIMILGLDVLPQYQRQGLATEIMKQYLQRECGKGRKCIILTCLESKVKMYEKMGYTNKGVAQSTWGGEQWYEMYQILNV